MNLGKNLDRFAEVAVAILLIAAIWTNIGKPAYEKIVGTQTQIEDIEFDTTD